MRTLCDTIGPVLVSPRCLLLLARRFDAAGQIMQSIVRAAAAAVMFFGHDVNSSSEVLMVGHCEIVTSSHADLDVRLC